MAAATVKPYDKTRLITIAPRQATTGIAFLAVALSSVVFLGTDVVCPVRAAAIAAAAVVPGAATLTWLAPSLLRRSS